MQDDFLKYELSNEQIDLFIKQAVYTPGFARIESGEKVMDRQPAKDVTYYFKPLFYAILTAIIIFSILTIVKTLNRKEALNPRTTDVLLKLKASD